MGSTGGFGVAFWPAKLEVNEGESLGFTGQVENEVLRIGGEVYVDILVDGQTRTSVDLGANGTFSGQITFPQYGTHTLTARWRDAMGREYAAKSHHIQAYAAPPTFDLFAETEILKSGMKYIFTLRVYRKGAPLPGARVIIRSPGLLQADKVTDYRGEVPFSLGPLKEGVLFVDVDYPEADFPASIRKFEFGVGLTTVPTTIAFQLIEEKGGPLIQGALVAPEPGGFPVDILQDDAVIATVQTDSGGVFRFRPGKPEGVVRFAVRFPGAPKDHVQYLSAESESVTYGSKFTSAPSVGTAILVGAIGLGIFAFARRRR